ncbi:Dps family protein [Brevundimonas sp. NPDC090276]|uniref:Dps family protein n=1 Tax=Brevundimonas sp. NPDC090276 TaxID=3363956 RepID=UPI00383A3116
MTAAIDTGLKPQERDEVARELSKVLADSFAVYQKTHGYHWNVRGPEFFSLHKLLEQQYNEIWAALDDIAERIRALGELAPQSASAFANLTSIKDGDPEKDASAMLKELIKDHGVLIATARAALDAADKVGDEASVDLMTQRLAAHEKAAWMLRSSLGDR